MLLNLLLLIQQYTKHNTHNLKKKNSRVTGAVGGAITQQTGANRYIPESMRGQVNQAVGQAASQAAMNELSSVFATKFK